MVMAPVKRGDTISNEPCEVVACQYAGDYASWSILVVTHDGVLLSQNPSYLQLIAEPATDGPYR